MRIAFVVHDFLRGVGHGRYCIELARRFSREHEIHVLANRFEADLDFAVQRHPVAAWRGSALASVLTFPGAAEKILARENFDLVHAQGFACWKADVITAHVCNAARYRQTPARGLVKRLFPAFVIPRERKFFQSAGASEIIAVSNFVKRELEMEYGVRDARVVYHGVNGEEFFPAKGDLKIKLRREFNLTGNAWVWLFAGEAAKGLAEAIEALVEFPEAHLLVVSRSCCDHFKGMARAAGVQQRIVFHGPVEQMARCYQAADVFVYPSEYDTFGMVVAEAMACGLPVVVGKNIGASEWIEDGRNGFVCGPADLAAQLRKVRDVTEEISRRAWETALSHSWEDCARRTMDIYERAMASKRQRR
jgi:UDP-glucose:(heptosyl)LPS alpha-1,3-glucosyltransferase